MSQLVIDIFQYFAYETGIIGNIRKYNQAGIIFLFILSITMVVIGFYSYRFVFAVLVFITTALSFSTIMGNRTDWGEVVTWFVVVGMALGFLGYQTSRLSASVTGAVYIGTIVSCYIPLENSVFRIVLVCLTMLITSLFTLGFPVISINFLCSLWGSVLLVDMLPLQGLIKVLVMLVCMSGGFIIQMFLTRKQTLFQEIYPKKVQYYIDNRKKVKQ